MNISPVIPIDIPTLPSFMFPFHGPSVPLPNACNASDRGEETTKKHTWGPAEDARDVCAAVPKKTGHFSPFSHECLLASSIQPQAYTSRPWFGLDVVALQPEPADVEHSAAG